MKESKDFIRDFYHAKKSKNYFNMGITVIEVEKRSAKITLFHLDKKMVKHASILMKLSVEFYYNGMNVTATLLPSEEEQLFIGSCDCTESDWDSMTDEERGNLLCEGVVGYMDKSLVETDRV